MSAFAVDLVMRFCGGPLDSGGPCLPSTVRLLVGCAVAFACCCLSYFCLRRKMQCRIRFSSSIDIDTSDYDKIHKKLVSFKGGWDLFFFFFGQ